MTRDSDPDRWILKEHTKVKHELLQKYLGGWLPILGSRHKKLLLFDGFAGRGEYSDGSGGSPAIVLRKADELISAGRVSEVVCAFVEKDPDNFANLQDVLDQIKPQYPGVTVMGPKNDSFEEVVSDVIEKTQGRVIPSFWFIDPFGFTGMAFDTVRQIMSLKRSEVFVTLMLRDIGRFLSHPDLESTFDRLYGTRQWREIVDSDKTGEAKERELRDLYVSQLRAIGCMVTFFRVCMDDKLQTLYYMVHATNHPKGRRLMKDVMHRQAANGMFAYLGPQESTARMQRSLLLDDPIPILKAGLPTKFAGRTIGFEALRNECCDDDELRDAEYRNALKELRDEGKIVFRAVTSRTPRGLQGEDQITFPSI